MATYYVAVNGQHTGPYTLDQLSQLNISPDTLVWNDSMPNWTEAGKVAELQSLFHASQPGYQQPGYHPNYTQPLEQRTVGFGEAVKRFFSNYATFTGRASRSEYWFATLFNCIVTWPLCFIYIILVFKSDLETANLVYGIISLYGLATLVPNLAIVWRRLHDTGRSGAWYFIGFIPLIGAILLLIYFCQESQPYENEYGPVPNTDSEY